MAATGITAVRDALAELIEAAWDRDNPADEVVKDDNPDIDSATIQGRKVYIMRTRKEDAPATRGEDQNDYSFVLLVVEKFTEQGKPEREWVDGLIDWMEWLLRITGNTLTVRLLSDEDDPTAGLWPEVAEIAVLYDVDKLRQLKMFASQINLTYREQVAA